MYFTVSDTFKLFVDRLQRGLHQLKSVDGNVEVRLRLVQDEERTVNTFECFFQLISFQAG